MRQDSRSVAFLVGRFIAFLLIAGALVGAGALVAVFVALAVLR